MHWREVIAKTSAFLDRSNVPDAEVAAELLAARLLKAPRGFLAPSLDLPASDIHLEAMRRGIRRLVTGEPLQYVLGEWDFRHLTIGCDRRALIPRPETEELVTHVLDYLNQRFSDGGRPFIIDVGTGTGAIILSIASEFKGEGVFLGSDISEDALRLADANAARCKLSDRVKFVAMDGLDDFNDPGIIDVIVSNPPYVESAVCDTLDRRVRDFEPRLALDGGKTGLDFYERYLFDAFNLLKPGGGIFFEIGESQGEAVRGMMTGYGMENIRIAKDLAGLDRYAMATMPR